MKEYIISDDFLDAETIASAEVQGYLHEIVRCKECKYRGNRCLGIYYMSIECKITGNIHYINWFCADGKRGEIE